MSGQLFAKGAVALTASGMSGETLHSSVDIPAGLMEAGRVVKFCACIKVDTDGGPDTWQVRVRLGGVSGTLVLACNDLDADANSTGFIEGYFVVVSEGTTDGIVSGAASGYGTAIASVTGATLVGTNTMTDANTNAPFTLAITSQCSTTSPNETVQVTFLRAWVEAGMGTVETPLP